MLPWSLCLHWRNMNPILLVLKAQGLSTLQNCFLNQGEDRKGILDLDPHFYPAGLPVPVPLPAGVSGTDDELRSAERALRD